MPSVKHPCLQCKEKHVKCDEARPKCRRCELRNLPCARPERRTIFRHGTVDSFARDQTWVPTTAAGFRVDARTETVDDLGIVQVGQSRPSPQLGGHHDAASQKATGLVSRNDHQEHTHHPQPQPQPQPLQQHSAQAPGLLTQSAIYPTTELRLPGVASLTSSGLHAPSRPNDPALASVTDSSLHYASPHILSPHVQSPRVDRHRPSRYPLQDVQEACLLRYFVDELAQWFDLCDEHRHFQLVVPIRAQYHSHLLHAIFALSARHLSRVPEFKTPRGIVYRGQLLPQLHESAAVEYMLECIPALRQFHDDSSDDEYRDSVIATAVILRQLEEIDDDEQHGERGGQGSQDGAAASLPAVNFLAVIDSVLRSSTSQALFSRRSLIQASYWMALRQEIFHSFTRKQQPQMFLAPEYWHGASGANKAVIHTIQVARWLWGERSEGEWGRLVRQQEHLEEDVLYAFQPIYKREADKTKGEIFPTIWYASNTEAVSILLSITSKMVLVAENPSLRNPPASRSSLRSAETQVRTLTLDLCGVALCSSASSPATLVNAAIGIQLYGDFFTDGYERRALRGVVERYRDAHAWPVQELLDMFR